MQIKSVLYNSDQHAGGTINFVPQDGESFSTCLEVAELIVKGMIDPIGNLIDAEKVLADYLERAEKSLNTETNAEATKENE